MKNWADRRVAPVTKAGSTILDHWSATGQLTMIFLVAATFQLHAVKAADWPGWRGPARTGISPESGLNWAWSTNGPRQLWKVSVGKGFSSWAVAGGRAYTLGNSSNIDTIFCLEATTGRVLWKHSYDCPLDPLAHEGGPGSTPAIDGDRLYTLSKAGHLFCLEAQTGGVLWTNKFETPPTGPEDYRVWWGYAGSPLVANQHLVLSLGNSGLVLNKQSGQVVWQSPPGRPGYSSPVPFAWGGKTGYVFLSGHEVVAAGADNGQVLWRIPWRTTWDQNASDPLVAEGKLFVSTGHGVGCALFELASGKPTPVWRHKHMRTELSTCVLWQGYVYGYDQKRLTCLDWRTGQVKWAAEEAGQGSLILADGKLIALEETGELVVAAASSEAFQPIARAQILSGRCWSVPALADGRLFARNSQGEAVCLSLR